MLNVHKETSNFAALPHCYFLYKLYSRKGMYECVLVLYPVVESAQCVLVLYVPVGESAQGVLVCASNTYLLLVGETPAPPVEALRSHLEQLVGCQWSCVARFFILLGPPQVCLYEEI